MLYENFFPRVKNCFKTCVVGAPSIGVLCNASINTMAVLSPFQVLVFTETVVYVLIQEPRSSVYTAFRVNVLASCLGVFCIFNTLNSVSLPASVLCYFAFVFGAVYYVYYWILYVKSINVRKELSDKCTIECVRLVLTLCSLVFFTLYVLMLAIFQSSTYMQPSVNYLIYKNVYALVSSVPMLTIAGRVSKSILLRKEKELEVKASFIRFIVHELKLPIDLASMGLGSVCKEINEYSHHTKCQEFLVGTRQSISAASGMLHDISTLDKLNNRMIQLSRREVVIKDFVLSTLQFFQVEAVKKNIFLDFSGCAKPEFETQRIWIDPSKMAQVIRILLSNAFKYTLDNGHIQVSLRYMTVESSGTMSAVMFDHFTSLFKPRHLEDVGIVKYVRIEVKDNGRGMSSESSSRLFNGNLVSPNEMHGLGLHIARQFVELHGGRIGAFSPGVNEGSIFYVDLLLGDLGEQSIGHEREHETRKVANFEGNIDELDSSATGSGHMGLFAAVPDNDYTDRSISYLQTQSDAIW